MDVFTKRKRSEVMSRIRSTGNKETEIALMRIFKEHHVLGWRRGLKLAIPISDRREKPEKQRISNIRPDFVFRAEKVVIFVDGDFWHGHPTRGRIPSSNQDYWRRKIEGNKRRDRLQTLLLQKKGWTVVRIWQYQLVPKYQHWALRKLRKVGLIH